jgi:ABC-type sugar transport system permease subunit
MALIALVIVFPLAYSFYLSFKNDDLSVGPEYEFVGTQNYTEALFRDARFMGSVWNTAVLIAPSLALELLLGLGIALLLSRVLRGRPFITAYYPPCSSRRSPRPCWSRARCRCSLRGRRPASGWAIPPSR